MVFNPVKGYLQRFEQMLMPDLLLIDINAGLYTAQYLVKLQVNATGQ